jgi:hypothetical protein
MIKEASLKQACQTLKIIADQTRSSQDLKVMNNGYLSDLIAAIQDGGIPCRGEFQRFLNVWPSEIEFEAAGASEIKKEISAGEYSCSFTDEKEFAEIYSFAGKRRRVVGRLFRSTSFLESCSENEILEKMKKGGFRPATLEELVSFGATFREPSRLVFVALGTLVNGYLASYRPVIKCINGKRQLSTQNKGTAWGPLTRFLGIRK